jgi:ATP synthase protein I
MKEVDPHTWRQIGSLASLGITFVVSTAIGLAIGYQLDRWLKTSPWLTILFLLFGIAAGFVNLFRETARMQGDD